MTDVTEAGLGLPLDAIARDSIRLLARILARRGHAAAEAIEEFRKAYETIVAEVQTPLSPVEPEIPEAPHVMTLWHDDTTYVDDEGEPRKIKATGPEPSFEALVRKVDPKLDTDRVLNYLIRDRVVRQEGDWYVPQNRGVVLATDAGPAAYRTVRVVSAFLRTCGHNLDLDPSDRLHRWFERISENRDFPLSKLAEFAAFLEQHGDPFLKLIDAYMRVCEAAKEPHEPTIKLGVGVFRYQED